MKELQAKLLSAFNAEHRDHIAAARAMLDAYETAGLQGPALDVVELYRRLHSLKGAARAVGMRPVEELAHALEGLIEDHQAQGRDLGAEEIATVRSALDRIEDAAAAILQGAAKPAPGRASRFVNDLRGGDGSGAPTTLHEEPTPLAVQDLTRVSTQSFDELVQCSSEILGELESQNDTLRLFVRVDEQLKEQAAAGRKVGRASGDTKARKDVEQSIQDAIARQRAHLWRTRRLGRSLQEQLGRLQTAPAGEVFGASGRIIRDIARQEGKRVNIAIRGLELSADRNVLLRLKDPVMHLLRNAVHHGIEPPEERRRAGKPDEGNILFDISANGAGLVFTVEDDGRGFDKERIFQRARECGLMDAPAQGPAGDAYLASLIMQPGLSTEESVNEVAGRGMGLSVVSDAVQRLGGGLTVASREPCGLRVTLKTVASTLITRLALVESAGRVAAFPVSQIKRIRRISCGDIQTIDGRAHATDGSAPPMALAPLEFLLERGGPELDGEVGRIMVVELESDSGRFGVVVDAVFEILEGVIRDLHLHPDKAGCVAGGVVLKTDTVVPVLDPGALIDVYRQADARCMMRMPGVDARAARISILVVDDSITTRTLEKSILEANGYDVRLSVDGADALRELRREAADLVVSDIEMPRLNGFDLLSSMKKDPMLTHIPVLLVTSRNDEADRRRGLELGADAYVVKQRFDQNALLKTIERLV